ncbi:RXT2-like protein [Xylariales sp. PMI_506]|nr:RXT2-like protein [Xylariales sp. PMI_506]
MASQQALFADTILAMKKALKRRAYESDSDDDIDYRGNRGQKLKKRARFAREGQVAPPSGPEVYREIVTHAGYTRAIISRNPPRVDDEGYEPESDDEDYEERMAEIAESAAEFNPYASLRLENILAPLTAVTDLPAHPTLSRPYTTKTLTDLTRQAREVMHKENSALWKVKHLQTKLVGDHVWVPCEVMETPSDMQFYQEPHPANGVLQRIANSTTDALLLDSSTAANSGTGHPSINGETAGTASEDTTSGKQSPRKASNPIAKANSSADDSTTRQDTQQNSDNKSVIQPNPGSVQSETRTKENKEHRPEKDHTPSATTNGVMDSGELEPELALNGTHNDAHLPASGPMSTASLDALDDMFIHPIFLAPRSALPDRDVGIPEAEAEDLRRLLQLWVQKQEEVCRGVKRLNEGLLRADRLRKTVLQWSKYEAHCGPNRDMSDGEDWYDKEEWGFDEDLKKGQDEEEEDTMQTTKKTRTRR